MTLFVDESPFHPGAGMAPPHMAGRGEEKRRIERMLRTIEGGKAVSRNLILIGPRGTGKTTLLLWAGHRARDLRIDTVRLTPKAFPDIDSLAGRLVPPNRFARLLPRELGVDLLGIGAKWDLSGDAGAFEDLLAARCARRPLAVLLDEAHLLDLDAGNVLLNASQSVRGDGAPLLLALAGTPGLEDRLNAMGTSFWERSAILGIDRLDAEAATESLTRPLAEHGVAFDEAAIGRVAAEAQAYPYFLQCWGDALWEALAERGIRVIDDAVIEAARSRVGKTIDGFYGRRMVELGKRHLLLAAEAVARAYETSRANSYESLYRAVARETGRTEDDASVASEIDALCELGYVWRVPDGVEFRPGIPSLMRWVLARTEPPASPSGPENVS